VLNRFQHGIVFKTIEQIYQILTPSSIFYFSQPSPKIRRAFLPHPPARRKSESRRFEKISRGKADPFLPQKMLCFAQSALGLAVFLPALLLCRSTTPRVVARSARETLWILSGIFDKVGSSGIIKTLQKYRY